MAFEERHGAILAEEGVLAGDGLPDEQAIEGIAMIRGVGKLMKRGEDFRGQGFFGQAELPGGGWDLRGIGARKFQFPEPEFQADLPVADRADDDFGSGSLRTARVFLPSLAGSNKAQSRAWVSSIQAMVQREARKSSSVMFQFLKTGLPRPASSPSCLGLALLSVNGVRIATFSRLRPFWTMMLAP